jgi:uncharacterized glyoxalase superfamily protein PhnB
MPYLILKGANDFIDFTKKVFNAKVELIVPRSEGVIMHGELTIGKAAIMFADATDDYKPFPSSMFILIENIDEVYKLGLKNGAISTQEIDERNYGRSAGFKDPFGNQWWLTQPSEKLNA